MIISVTSCNTAWQSTLALTTFINDSYPQALNNSTITTAPINSFNLSGFTAPNPFPYNIYRTSPTDGSAVDIFLNTNAIWWSFNTALDLNPGTAKTLKLSITGAVAGTKQHIFIKPTNNVPLTIDGTTRDSVVKIIGDINLTNGKIYVLHITYTPNDAVCEIFDTYSPQP